MTDHAPPRLAAQTLAVQAMGKIDAASRAIVPPVHVTTTYIRDPDNQYRSGNVYGRPDNETVREAEGIVAMLEGAPSAMVFGSGQSAAIAAFLALAPGDHIVAPRTMYWFLRSWLLQDARHWGLATDFVDMGDLDAVQAAMRPGQTRLVWIETPANPTWAIIDIAAVCAIARKAGARTIVDSTCATPVLTRPLEFGADMVMHSATKYLNGHSDVIAGALATAQQDDFWARIRRNRAAHGMILGPWEAFLLIRGMRTLHLRVRAACATAMDLAQRLSNNAGIAEVLYPGLPTHAGHAVAQRQMHGGYGGMLSIRTRGGEAAAIGVAARVAVWKRATSLGGVESLIEHRASIEGAGSPCPPDLLRLSAGLEDIDDLHRDLVDALHGVT